VNNLWDGVDNVLRRVDVLPENIHCHGHAWSA
jgi:hypothetical protein